MPRFAGKSTDTGVPITIKRDRYAEGDTDVIFEGNIVLGEKLGNVVFPVHLDASGYLKVYLDGNVTLQTEYEDDALNGVSKGTLVMGDDGANLQNISVDANGYLQIEIVEGDYNNIKYEDGEVVALPSGTVALGYDGTNVLPVVVNSSGYLQIFQTRASHSNSVADVTLTATSTTQIVETLISRLNALISNKRTNTQIFRIGDVNVGASRGVELAPGESISIETTEAIYGYNPGGSESVLVVLRERDDNPESPAIPTLISPINGEVISNTSITFQWNPSLGATDYQIRVSTDSAVEDPLFHEDVTGGATSKNYNDFPNDGTVYYWKVRAYNAIGWSDWSIIRYLTNGSDGISTIDSGHLEFYDLGPRETKYFKFSMPLTTECSEGWQLGNTSAGGEPRTVHALVRRVIVPTVANFEFTWAMGISSHYDCGLDLWLPPKTGAEDMYWNYNTGSQAEFVEANEPIEAYWYYVMLYNDGDESVDNQRLTLQKWL